MEVALADALRCLLPSAAQTLFLQACLCRGDAVATAWREWTRAVEDPFRFLAEEGREQRGHLPLLYENLVERGVPSRRTLGRICARRFCAASSAGRSTKPVSRIRSML